jgi:putative ABC transport system ATP-binding protein
MSDAPLFGLQGVARVYGRGAAAVRALDGVDLDVAAGERVVITGASGSGKTTLLQILGALDRPSEGTVTFDGSDISELTSSALARLRASEFGFVFQQFNLIPTLSATGNVEAGLAPLGLGRAERAERAGGALDSVGLANRRSHLPSELSGGEQQRVAIARALARDPKVVLADEPTGNLDSRTGREVLELLIGAAEDARRTMIVITHDRDIAAQVPRVIEMLDGRIVADRRS